MLNKLNDRPGPRRLAKWLTAVGVAASLPVVAATTVGASDPRPDAAQEGNQKPAVTAKANEAKQKPKANEAKPAPKANEAKQKSNEAKQKSAPQTKTVEQKIVEAAQKEIGNEETGDNCQKYSDQCVSWCALFAMSTWEAAGVGVENEDYAFTGDVYTTGQSHGAAYDSSQLSSAKPGDVLLFGTGPSTASTSKHIGIVEKVDGNTVTTIEGNTGDDPDRVMRKTHELSSDTFYGGVHPF